MASPFVQSPLASQFMNTVQLGGLTNPYGLAAVYSTGKHESSWSPKNVFGEWSDPSASGEAGRAGGALSWRAGRLTKLRQFAQSRGDDPLHPSIETQAAFFLSEDPALIESLQSAGSGVEAQRTMDNAWRFAGYNRPGGEAARRLRTTRETLGSILGGEAGAQSMVGSGGQDQTEDSMATGGQQSGGAGGGGFLFPPLQKPKNRSEILAMVLKNMQDDANRPNPQSWGETAVRALTQGVQGYVAGNTMRKNEADEQRQREVLAGILQGNPQAAQLLQSGIGDMDTWESVILKQAFEGPKKPIVINGKLVDPDTYEVIQDFSDPKEPNLPSSVREFEYGKENPDFVEYQRGATKPSGRDRQAQMLMETGVPEDIAKGIASGRFVVSRHPTSEVAQVVDKATGQVVFDGNTQAGAPAASQGDPGAPVPGAEQGRPSYIPEDVDPAQATGGSGFFGGVINQISDLFGQGLPFPEIEEAAEALNTTQILTMSLLQAEVPGRPSQYLLEKLADLTVDAKSLLRADDRARVRLQQTRNLIQHEVDRVEKDILARPQEFKPSDMTKARLNASQLKGLLRAYDAMLGTMGHRRDEGRPGLDQFRRR